MSPAAVPGKNVPGKLADITGPGITDRWGVTCADLGASVLAPNGTLVSVFGDTFAGERVGRGDWRSPVILIGTGDARHRIRYQRAGGTDADYARQLWHYRHREPTGRRDRSSISTVIPSDLLRVDQMLYLHAIVNRGFGNVAWTEIWCSADSGVSWRNLGAKFPARLHRGHAQCWSWDYDPDDGWIYVVSTGFQRDKGIILRRVRPADIGDPAKYSGWAIAADDGPGAAPRYRSPRPVSGGGSCRCAGWPEAAGCSAGSSRRATRWGIGCWTRRLPNRPVRLCNCRW